MRLVKPVLLFLLAGTTSSIANAASTRDSKNPPLPSLQEVLVARKDLWGEAAMAQPNGPSYEFFEQLLPPPRYVNADFRYYPIVPTSYKLRVLSALRVEVAKAASFYTLQVGVSSGFLPQFYSNFSFYCLHLIQNCGQVSVAFEV